MRLIREFSELFEKLVGMLRRLGKHLSIFEVYARLYPTSKRLKESLVEAYTAFLDFYSETKTILTTAKSKHSLCMSCRIM
jgi:hypothetical protein